MNAEEFLKDGRLSAAVGQATEQVKANPSDLRSRTLLFELLCFSGDLDRASKQLDVLGSPNTDAEVAVQRYRNVLHGERLRGRLFGEGVRPGLPQQIPPYTELHLQAVDRLRENKAGEARALLEQAEQARPALSGQIDGEPFEDLKDADDLIGPFLEAITHTNYCWIPWEAIQSVTIAPPARLRDLLWIPAKIELHIGPLGEAFLPVLYYGSHQHPDDQVKLGRMTEWRRDVEELTLGLGQRLLVAGEQARALLEVRNITFDHANGPDSQ